MQEPETTLVPVQTFDHGPASVTENKRSILKRGKLDCILYDMCVAINSFTQIGRATSYVDLWNLFKTDHDDFSALMTRQRASSLMDESTSII